MGDWTLHLGDARAVLPTLAAGTFDACICDPPYPCIDRPYGRLTEAEWFDLMRAVGPEVRRVLKPKGSAVFVLQPNSERVGRMRPWLWDFLSWLSREWNVVQDAYWWNPAALPSGGIDRRIGLMRPSVKACVWAGAEDCHRDQGAVLWSETQQSVATRAMARFESKSSACGRRVVQRRMGDVALERGGATPFNLLPLARSNDGTTNGAATPLALCDWWVRYLVPPGGAVLDPFAGSGTTGVAALHRGCTFVGVEKEPAYVETARKRLAEVRGPLFAAVVGG